MKVKHSPEYRANARLICAAPYLLEGAIELGKAIEDGDMEAIAWRWINLKQVIEKVTGE